MSKFVINYCDDLSTEIIHIDSNSKILTDAPKDNNGLGRTFSPTDLVSSSLASCMMTIAGIAAKTNKIKIDTMNAEVEKKMSETYPRMISDVYINLKIHGVYEDKSKIILKRAIEKCPVHQSLSSKISIHLNIDFK